MKGRKILKAIHHMVTILVFGVILTMLFMVISQRVSGEEPSLFGYQIKTVLSGSMQPDIKTGSIIVIKKTETDHHFKKDNVITFKTESNEFATHRIQQIRNDGQSYITKGDANDSEDIEPVLQKNIIGLYKGITIPYLGYVMNFVSSKEGVALLLILPGIYLIIYSVCKNRMSSTKKLEVESDTKSK